MPFNWLYLRKFILIVLGLVLMVFAGVSFYESLHIKEPVVLSRGVTQREFTINNIEQKISIKKGEKGACPPLFCLQTMFSSWIIKKKIK